MAELAELLSFEGVAVVVPCTMRLRQMMRQQEALLYEHSIEVKE